MTSTDAPARAGDDGPSGPTPGDRAAVRRRSLLVGLAIGSSVLLLAVVAALLTRPEPATRTEAADVGRLLTEPGASRLVPDDRSGEPVPDADFETLAGGRGSLADYRGTPLVLNFFASTCEPCIREMPVLQAAHERLEGTVTFLGVDVNDPVDDGRRFVERLGVTYDVARDPTGSFMQAFGAVTLPATAFVSPDGRILRVVTGALTTEDLDGHLAEVFT